MDTQRSARTTILKERVKQLPNLPRGAFKDMLDQVVTTFSVSILTKEKGNALALRKYDKVERTLQTAPAFRQQKNKVFLTVRATSHPISQKC